MISNSVLFYSRYELFSIVKMNVIAGAGAGVPVGPNYTHQTPYPNGPHWPQQTPTWDEQSQQTPKFIRLDLSAYGRAYYIGPAATLNPAPQVCNYDIQGILVKNIACNVLMFVFIKFQYTYALLYNLFSLLGNPSFKHYRYNMNSYFITSC